MKITGIRARVFEWRGDIVPPQSHFCTNPVDILPAESPGTNGNGPVAPGTVARGNGVGGSGSGDTMASFRFHGWLVVEVETDAGHVGLGNAALAPRVAKHIVDAHLSPLVVGCDPWDYELLWQKMYRATMAWGRKGVAMAAVSAVDLAIWDVLGKASGLPVFKLLGGRTKERIPVYASKLYSQPPDDLAAEAKGYLDAGFRAMKMRFGWGPKDGAAGMRRNVELVKTVREVVGDEVDLMVEAYMGWTLEYARRMLPLLAPFHPRWLEEPVIPDDIAGYAELRALGIIPISGGEHEFTPRGCAQLLDARAVDVLQYDANRVGGVTAARKVNALAEAKSVPVIPHAGQMHNYHLVMSDLNCPMAEFFPVHGVEIGNELFYYLFEGDPEPEDGHLQLSDDIPGLGIRLNETRLPDFSVVE